jgi:hypothetical protein
MRFDSPIEREILYSFTPTSSWEFFREIGSQGNPVSQSNGIVDSRQSYLKLGTHQLGSDSNGT